MNRMVYKKHSVNVPLEIINDRNFLKNSVEVLEKYIL